MEENSKVDHVVVIDRGERAIWDCVERYGIWLSHENFRYCVGYSAATIEVEELKRFVARPTQASKKCRKGQEMNAKKVKEKRQASRL